MIAIDGMGGDYAPCAIVEGALLAAKHKKIPVTIFGDTTRIVAILHDLDPAWRSFPVHIHHCTQSVGMEEEVSLSLMKKKDSSLVQAILSVARGHAQAVVSAGNSGASLLAGVLHLGKVPGIMRPAIGSFLPTRNDSVFCLDLGANVEVKPEYLLQFAYMGNVYVRLIKNKLHPRIALLANGTESCKGTKVIQQAYQLLQDSPLNFIGNCEPGDLFNDVADVIVSEGFSGNIMLKSMESTVSIITQWLKDEGNRSWWARAVGVCGAPIFRRLKRNIQKVQRGGALLLGVAQPLVIAHGSSKASAIEDAILFAEHVVRDHVHMDFNNSIEQFLKVHNYKHLEQHEKSFSNLVK